MSVMEQKKGTQLQRSPLPHFFSCFATGTHVYHTSSKLTNSQDSLELLFLLSPPLNAWIRRGGIL